MTLRSRAGLPVTVLVAFAYILFAVFGTNCASAWMPGSHIATEMLHLSGATGVLAAPAGTAVAEQATPRKARTLSNTMSVPGPGPARVFPQPASVHAPAVLTYWLALIMAELGRPNVGRPVPWLEAPIGGAVLGRWHRSVVLHL